jgi:sulfur carrier protein ThiS
MVHRLVRWHHGVNSRPAVARPPSTGKAAAKRVAVALIVVFALIMSLAGGCVPTAIAENAILPSQPARFLDALIAERMARYHIPSEAVAVVKNGQVVLAKGYGYADLDRRMPVDPGRTLFRIGAVQVVRLDRRHAAQ